MKIFLLLFVLQHSMIFFFHRYELPALLEQIHQQQMPAHLNDQAANGHQWPSNDAQRDVDPDQYDTDRPESAEAEERYVLLSDAANVTDDVIADVDSQQSAVDHTVLDDNVSESSVQLLHGADVEKTSQQSAVLAHTTASASSHRSTDNSCDRRSADTDIEDETLSQSRVLPVPSQDICTSAADVGRYASPDDEDSCMELRQRYHVSRSATSPCSSDQAVSSDHELSADELRADVTLSHNRLSHTD